MRPRSDPRSFPRPLAEAVKADILFLAVRFEAHKEVAKALPSWKGKTIVDVTNAYGVPPEQLGGQPSSAKVVAEAFTDGRLVKGFNHPPSSSEIRPRMVAGESCSWRATMKTLQRRLVSSRNISVSRRSY